MKRNKTVIFFNSGDICKLQVKCQKHSSCESKHVSSSFPPGSYQCVCDEGYSSSGKRPGNVVAPGEHCTANPPPGKLNGKIRRVIMHKLSCFVGIILRTSSLLDFEYSRLFFRVSNIFIPTIPAPPLYSLWFPPPPPTP